MKLRLIRYHISENDTLGLLLVDGAFLCYTLEDEPRIVKLRGETCIPEGVYNVGLRYSPRFTPRYGHEMLHVLDVPNFEYILFHPGNRERDTDGCILVGDAVYFNPSGTSTLVQSRVCYNRIYPRLADAAKSRDLVLEVKGL